MYQSFCSTKLVIASMGSIESRDRDAIERVLNDQKAMIRRLVENNKSQDGLKVCAEAYAVAFKAGYITHAELKEIMSGVSENK